VGWTGRPHGNAGLDDQPAASGNREGPGLARAARALLAAGAYVVGSSPEEMSNYIKQAIPTWAKVIKAAGIKFD